MPAVSAQARRTRSLAGGKGVCASSPTFTTCMTAPVSDGIELVFETHSITEDNERGIATGWLGGALSPRGRELASELGRRRREDGIAAVFTSDLARAVETARIAFAGTSIPIHEDARLRECNYG